MMTEAKDSNCFIKIQNFDFFLQVFLKFPGQRRALQLVFNIIIIELIINTF